MIHCIISSNLHSAYSQITLISDFLTIGASQQSEERLLQFEKLLDTICNLDSNLSTDGIFIPMTTIIDSLVQEIKSSPAQKDLEKILIIVSKSLYSAGDGDLSFTEEENEFITPSRLLLNQVIKHAHLHLEEDLSLSKNEKIPNHIYAAIANKLLKLV